MGKRLAADGYVVLVPNPFYRSTREPGIGPGFDFQKPAGAMHGWCVPDMPQLTGRPIYAAAQAKRAWSELGKLFKQALI